MAPQGRAARRAEQWRRLGETEPRPVALDAPGVRIEEPGGRPALIVPAREDLDLPAWCRSHLSLLEALLDRHGAIRFRGFAPVSRAHFRETFLALCPSPMAYTDRSSPRTEVEAELYTSTDHPADQHIRMHCELSYSHRWPMRVGFFCLHPAPEGGETPLADTRRVLERLSGATRARFEASGVRYCRDLRSGIGLSWQEVFGARSREGVEQRCGELGIAYRWHDDGLRLEWTRPAIQAHPRTGQPVWFNHAAFFHGRALDPDVATALGDGPLPFWTSFGDGSPIPPDVFAEIEDAYRSAQVCEPWSAGDLVLVDNMLTAHARRPFRGRREVYVMMGAPWPGPGPGAA